MEIRHVMAGCPASLADPDREWEKWMRLIKSDELDDQLRAVQKAHDAATRLGLVVPTWTRPASA